MVGDKNQSKQETIRNFCMFKNNLKVIKRDKLHTEKFKQVIIQLEETIDIYHYQIYFVQRQKKNKHTQKQKKICKRTVSRAKSANYSTKQLTFFSTLLFVPTKFIFKCSCQ